jgi:hypothetical protein
MLGFGAKKRKRGFMSSQQHTQIDTVYRLGEKLEDENPYLEEATIQERLKEQRGYYMSKRKRKNTPGEPSHGIVEADLIN